MTVISLRRCVFGKQGPRNSSRELRVERKLSSMSTTYLELLYPKKQNKVGRSQVLYRKYGESL